MDSLSYIFKKWERADGNCFLSPGTDKISGATTSFPPFSLSPPFLPAKPSFSEASIFISLQHTGVWADIQVPLPQGWAEGRIRRIPPPAKAGTPESAALGWTWAKGTLDPDPSQKEKAMAPKGLSLSTAKNILHTGFFIPVLLGLLNTTCG